MQYPFQSEESTEEEESFDKVELSEEVELLAEDIEPSSSLIAECPLRKPELKSTARQD